MKVREFVKKYSKKGALVGAISVACTAPAFAALDAGVTTAIATAKTDIGEAQTLIIGLAVFAMAGRWVKATFF